MGGRLSGLLDGHHAIRTDGHSHGSVAVKVQSYSAMTKSSIHKQSRHGKTLETLLIVE